VVILLSIINMSLSTTNINSKDILSLELFVKIFTYVCGDNVKPNASSGPYNMRQVLGAFGIVISEFAYSDNDLHSFRRYVLEQLALKSISFRRIFDAVLRKKKEVFGDSCKTDQLLLMIEEMSIIKEVFPTISEKTLKLTHTFLLDAMMLRSNMIVTNNAFSIIPDAGKVFRGNLRTVIKM